MINFVNKEDKAYKTKPRFHERRITDRGLCIWQMNKMLRGTGLKIQRLMDMYKSVNTSQLLLVPTGYKKIDQLIHLLVMVMLDYFQGRHV